MKGAHWGRVLARSLRTCSCILKNEPSRRSRARLFNPFTLRAAGYNIVALQPRAKSCTLLASPCPRPCPRRSNAGIWGAKTNLYFPLLASPAAMDSKGTALHASFSRMDFYIFIRA